MAGGGPELALARLSLVGGWDSSLSKVSRREGVVREKRVRGGSFYRASSRVPGGELRRRCVDAIERQGERRVF